MITWHHHVDLLRCRPRGRNGRPHLITAGHFLVLAWVLADGTPVAPATYLSLN